MAGMGAKEAMVQHQVLAVLVGRGATKAMVETEDLGLLDMGTDSTALTAYLDSLACKEQTAYSLQVHWQLKPALESLLQEQTDQVPVAVALVGSTLGQALAATEVNRDRREWFA